MYIEVTKSIYQLLKRCYLRIKIILRIQLIENKEVTLFVQLNW